MENRSKLPATQSAKVVGTLAANSISTNVGVNSGVKYRSILPATHSSTVVGMLAPANSISTNAHVTAGVKSSVQIASVSTCKSCTNVGS